MSSMVNDTSIVRRELLFMQLLLNKMPDSVADSVERRLRVWKVGFESEPSQGNDLALPGVGINRIG